MTDVDQEQMNGGERPRLSLQRRLGIVLSRDDHVSRDEIRALVQEVDDEAARLDVAAKEFKAASLDLECTDPVAADKRQKECMIERQRYEAIKPRLEEKLAAAVRRENHDRWLSDKNRVIAKRDACVKKYRDIPEIVAELIDLFLEAKTVDTEIDRVNAGGPSNAPRLAGVELTARRLSAFTRENPSLAEVTTLFDWRESSKQIWPPPQKSFGLIMAESMTPPSPDPRYSDRWFESQGDRRAEQEAAAARTADYYERQNRLREEREQQEDQARLASNNADRTQSDS
jgi:hypothetical protein